VGDWILIFYLGYSFLLIYSWMACTGCRRRPSHAGNNFTGMKLAPPQISSPAANNARATFICLILVFTVQADTALNIFERGDCSPLGLGFVYYSILCSPSLSTGDLKSTTFSFTSRSAISALQIFTNYIFPQTRHKRCRART
jgi:hypothetical protein